MEKIVAATQNKGKIREIDEITSKLGFSVISREEAGVPEDFDTDETGTTFEENSQMKAEDIMRITGMSAVADDSGLVVDALGGEPGVYSARYAGEDHDDAANRKLVLKRMEGVPEEERTARFVCVVTLVRPDGSKTVCRGTVEGHIIEEERGENGFGYDPIFVPEGYDRTFAEMTAEEKNGISHRGNALKALEEKLGNI